MKTWLLTGLLFMAISATYAQGKITGIISDGSGPLPGANIVVKGTSEATSVDFDGKFTLTTTKNSGEVVVSFIGNENKTIKFNFVNGSTVDLGTIVLSSSSNQLNEIVVMGKGIIDLATERKTPIAVSTIKAAEIQAKVGTSDITQTMVNTPSVYVAGQSGGFGDSRISVRGFAQDNTAFLLNGQPINGMEDGKIYWSNWSGMSDIANAVQIQRGLGSSKLAISSVGGTVNFITKATDKREGGFASVGVANDNYFKTTAAYSTGMSESGWGTSVMLSHWQGDGYNDGTAGQGETYFISVGYKANERHNFNFLLTGAPQEHEQNYGKKLSVYEKYGRKYNNNGGVLNGEYLSAVGNYYHKPVANLNWDFDITEKSSLSTVLYASWGRGGSIGTVGSTKRTADGYVDYDAIIAANEASADGAATFALRNSVNNHEWYGLVSNFKTALTENLSLNTGLDLRTYQGLHFRQITNLLGADFYLDKFNKNIPNNKIFETYSTDRYSVLTNYADKKNRYSWDYDETINYGGIFGQLEYSKNNFSTFFQGSLSSQSHTRTDRYAYFPENQEAEKVNNIGYNAKGGASYKIDQIGSFYANAGYYSRQPYHDNIYLNFGNEVNPLTKNEKILGLELGYTYSSEFLTASVNAYRTSWKDRVTTTSTEVNNLQEYKTNEGVEQLHTGVELDFVAKPLPNLDVTGFASVGNWEYAGNSVITIRDEDRNVISSEIVDVDGGKVGDAAQTTFGLGAKYEIFTRFSVDADWRNYAKLYSNAGAVKNNLELPNYDIMDAGISYKILAGTTKQNSILLRLNVNNVFDEVYISELTTNIASNGTDLNVRGINTNNNGYYGLGRTWNFSVRFNF
ncbi:TonB-dependent receptor [Flavobacterium sp. TMP13]|uniref:TonB-dependent receptor n=1 Tax=Flavobacterium sp. TMP13 TaxID=3425950 RepID=UPI003D7866AD